MDTILVAITGLSLAVTVGMGAILVRTLRLERRRSDARVALLEELAAARAETRVSAPTPVRSATRPQPRSTFEPRATEMPLRTGALDDFEFRPDPGRDVTNVEIFEAHHEPSAWPRRFAVIGVLASALFAVFFGWRALSSSDSVPAASTEVSTQAPVQPAASASQPLELLSLQHAQKDGTLVISGLVQNPRGSAALAGVQATVVLFDANGGTLSSSRAPIDFTTLAPGDESSFVIRVPSAGAVTRYRVGFRGEDDRILSHVDRRNNDTVARKQTP